MFSIYIILFYAVLLAIKPTRKLALALTPWLIFACSYDWMRLLPNYEVNPIDVRGLYDAEKALFGIGAEGARQIPGEYFAQHHCGLADFMAGLFYLCWVPLPVIYALVLQWQGHGDLAIRLTSAFLIVNLVGFAGYYIHPASPPWYVIEYGFMPVVNTPGNVGGFEHFDRLLHTGIFHSIYGKNANVFAAIPSLHAAYNPIALFYAMKVRDNRLWQTVLAVVSAGIWFSAVYSCHHYIIDVTLGVLTTIIGIALFESILLRIPQVNTAYIRLSAWLSR